VIVGRLIAIAVHEVVTEYRRLSSPPAPAGPQAGPAPVPGRDPESLPGCDAQLSYQEDAHEVRAFGFGSPRR
jgi:hypothetical protein